MSKFDGQVVVVTGGGGGIGGAACRRFAAEGAKVAVFDMNLAGAFLQDGAAFQCDITNRAQVDAAVAAAEAQLGPIHVLVNNAAGTSSSPSPRPCPPSGTS